MDKEEKDNVNKEKSKLVQLKLNIGASGGEFTPPEVENWGNAHL